MEELETNKFWDFSRNIDLEDFDTQRVYRILMNQDRFIKASNGPFINYSPLWSLLDRSPQTSAVKGCL